MDWRYRWQDLVIYLMLDIMSKMLRYKFTVWYEPKVAILLIFLYGFVFTYLIIFIYDSFNMDPVYIEHMKHRLHEKQEITHYSSSTRRIMKLRKKGGSFLLFGVVPFDPTLTALVFREGIFQWNGIPSKVLKIVVISVIICSVTFICLTYSVTGLIGIIFH